MPETTNTLHHTTPVEWSAFTQEHGFDWIILNKNTALILQNITGTKWKISA